MTKNNTLLTKKIKSFYKDNKENFSSTDTIKTVSGLAILLTIIRLNPITIPFTIATIFIIISFLYYNNLDKYKLEWEISQDKTVRKFFLPTYIEKRAKRNLVINAETNLSLGFQETSSRAFNNNLLSYYKEREEMMLKAFKNAQKESKKLIKRLLKK